MPTTSPVDQPPVSPSTARNEDPPLSPVIVETASALVCSQEDLAVPLQKTNVSSIKEQEIFSAHANENSAEIKDQALNSAHPSAMSDESALPAATTFMPAAIADPSFRQQVLLSVSERRGLQGKSLKEGATSNDNDPSKPFLHSDLPLRMSDNYSCSSDPGKQKVVPESLTQIEQPQGSLKQTNGDVNRPQHINDDESENAIGARADNRATLTVLSPDKIHRQFSFHSAPFSSTDNIENLKIGASDPPKKTGNLSTPSTSQIELATDLSCDVTIPEVVSLMLDDPVISEAQKEKAGPSVPKTTEQRNEGEELCVPMDMDSEPKTPKESTGNNVNSTADGHCSRDVPTSDFNPARFQSIKRGGHVRKSLISGTSKGNKKLNPIVVSDSPSSGRESDDLLPRLSPMHSDLGKRRRSPKRRYATRSSVLNDDSEIADENPEPGLSEVTAPTRELRSLRRSHSKSTQAFPSKGDIIRVLWPIDELYYEAKVESILSFRGKKFFDVLYDTGEAEYYMDLSVRNWRFADGRDGKTQDEMRHGKTSDFDWSNFPKVGDRIFVQWHVDLKYYAGVVRDVMAVENRYFYDVDYEGGDREFFLDLRVRKWTYPDPKTPPHPLKQSRNQASRRPRRASAPSGAKKSRITTDLSSDGFSAITQRLRRKVERVSESFADIQLGGGRPNSRRLFPISNALSRTANVRGSICPSPNRFAFDDFMCFNEDESDDGSDDDVGMPSSFSRHGSQSLFALKGSNPRMGTNTTRDSGVHSRPCHTQNRNQLSRSHNTFRNRSDPNSILSDLNGASHETAHRVANQFQWRRASDVCTNLGNSTAINPFSFTSPSSGVRSSFLSMSRSPQLDIKDIIAIAGKAAQKWAREKTQNMSENLDVLGSRITELKESFASQVKLFDRLNVVQEGLQVNRNATETSVHLTEPQQQYGGFSDKVEKHIMSIKTNVASGLRQFKTVVEDREKSLVKEFSQLKSLMSEQSDELISTGKALQKLNGKGLDSLTNLDPVLLRDASSAKGKADHPSHPTESVAFASDQNIDHSVENPDSGRDNVVIRHLKRKLAEAVRNGQKMDDELRKVRAREENLIAQKKETIKELSRMRSERDVAVGGVKSKLPQKRGPGRPPTRSLPQTSASPDLSKRQHISKTPGVAKRRNSRRESAVLTRSTGRANRKSLPPKSAAHNISNEVFLVQPDAAVPPPCQISDEHLARQMDRQAAELLATISAVWLLQDESRSEPPKVSGWHQENWVRRCTLNCLKHTTAYLENVTGVMSAKRNLREDIDGEMVTTDWLLSDDETGLEKARSNYGLWEPSLEDAEWNVEKVVLRSLNLCFKNAFETTSTKQFPTVIGYAKAIAQRALSEFEVIIPPKYAPPTVPSFPTAPVASSVCADVATSLVKSNVGTDVARAGQPTGTFNHPSTNISASIPDYRTDSSQLEKLTALVSSDNPSALGGAPVARPTKSCQPGVLSFSIPADSNEHMSSSTPETATLINLPPNSGMVTVSHAPHPVTAPSTVRASCSPTTENLTDIVSNPPLSQVVPPSENLCFPVNQIDVTSDSRSNEMSNLKPSATFTRASDLQLLSENGLLTSSRHESVERYQLPDNENALNLAGNLHPMMPLWDSSDPVSNKSSSLVPNPLNPAKTLKASTNSVSGGQPALTVIKEVVLDPNGQCAHNMPSKEPSSAPLYTSHTAGPSGSGTRGEINPLHSTAWCPPLGSSEVRDFVDPVSRKGAERLRQMTEGVDVPPLDVPSSPEVAHGQVAGLRGFSAKGIRGTPRSRTRSRGNLKGRGVPSGVRKIQEGKARRKSTRDAHSGDELVYMPAPPQALPPMSATPLWQAPSRLPPDAAIPMPQTENAVSVTPLVPTGLPAHPNRILPTNLPVAPEGLTSLSASTTTVIPQSQKSSRRLSHIISSEVVSHIVNAATMTHSDREEGLNNASNYLDVRSNTVLGATDNALSSTSPTPSRVDADVKNVQLNLGTI